MIIILMIAGAYLMYTFLEKMYMKLWNKDLTIEMSLSSDHATHGEEIILTEVVTNRKRIPLPFIHVNFSVERNVGFTDVGDNTSVSDKIYRSDVYSLLMYQRVTRKIPVKCLKRGVSRIREVDIVSSGLFMNNMSIIKRKENMELTIYPDPYRMKNVDILYSSIFGNIEKNAQRNPDPFAFRQIRDYDTSDPLNTVNWKASARTGKLMVNQYNETMCQSVCILLNLEPEGAITYESVIEDSISIAAGIAAECYERGISVSLLSNGRDIDDDGYIKVRKSTGKSQYDKICIALARIDVKKKFEDYLQIIKENTRDYTIPVFESNNSENIVYIIISSNIRQDFQESIDMLSHRGEKSIWIVPKFGTESVALTHCNAHVIEWEVGSYAAGEA